VAAAEPDRSTVRKAVGTAAVGNATEWFDSFLEFGTLGGFTLGAVISTALITTLSDEAISRWGWRIRSWSHSHSVSSGSTCG
jgi:hypothetical protein